MSGPQLADHATTELRGRVVVVGGGITGLAAAYHLQELAPQLHVQLLEAGPQLGGVLRTEQRDGYLIEHGADSLLTREPWGIDLCRRVGLEAELLPTEARFRRAFVVCRGRLRPVPSGFVLMQPRSLWPILTSPILPWSAKLRLLREPWVPVREATSEESIADYASRRLGPETYQRLIQPLVGGIYTGDPQRLSMAATFPQFVEAEQQHGSLVRAARRMGRPKTPARDAGAGYSQFVAPRQGMAQLATAVAARLSPQVIQCGRPVTAVRSRPEGQWSVVTDAAESTCDCDGVLVTTPNLVASRLLQETDAALASALAAVPRTSTSIVTLGYARQQIKHPLDGFGLVVPQVEQRRILAASFPSVKFAGRAPPGHVLIRVFLGGALQPEWNECDDATLQQVAQQELAELIGAAGPPNLCAVARWRESMPQYELGHAARVQSIESRVARWPGLELAGNAYRGVGVPACIQSGQQAAERLLATLLARS